ncbi:hypothetical protein B0T10DRAFT_563616 [Thelonectria olida]|uniref:CFEM domain-containing protein n=1 Tax=Thelonectria olida TaxID=1576542 RepID=A0A9P9AMJ1_9HYPO|nr:hypothetical protein B0T10DRAFT_563616 [Thelonectria olida]
MRTINWVFLMPLFFLARYGAAEPSEDLSQMPACATDCFHVAVSMSSCFVSDLECLCSDSDLQQMLDSCVAITCTVEESLVAKNISMTACEIPPRDVTGGYIALSNVLFAIAGALVIQRFAARLYLKAGLGLDDFFILLALFSWIPIMAMNNTRVSENGLGRDIWTLTPGQISQVLRDFFFSAVCYFVATPFLKLSILLFYRRVFPAPGMRKIIWSTVIFVAVVGVAFLFAIVFQCYPTSYFWTRWAGEHKGQCSNVDVIGVANAVINVVTSVWMLAIPSLQLHRLDLDLWRKLEVGAMFLVGIFSTVFSILRLTSIIKVEHSTNPSWDYVQLQENSVIEVATGIICACLPSTRLLLARFFPKIFPPWEENSVSEAEEMEKFTHRMSPRSRKQFDNVFTEISLDGEDDQARLVWIDSETRDALARLSKL